MQPNPTIVRDLTTLLSKKLFIDVPSAETDLIESGLLDSLQLVQVLLHIENDFGCRMALDELELDDLRSVSRLAQAIGGRIALPA